MLSEPRPKSPQRFVEQSETETVPRFRYSEARVNGGKVILYVFASQNVFYEGWIYQSNTIGQAEYRLIKMKFHVIVNPVKEKLAVRKEYLMGLLL